VAVVRVVAVVVVVVGVVLIVGSVGRLVETGSETLVEIGRDRPPLGSVVGTSG
jgi:hypothetical protein